MSERAMNIDCWSPGLILDHLRKGYVLPRDWRERLERAGYKVAPTEDQLAFEVTR